MKKSKNSLWWIVVAVVILGLGTVSTFIVHNRAEISQRDDLLSHARIAAEAIGVDDFGTLTGTSADLESPQYQSLKKTMMDIKSVQDGVHFVYLMGLPAQAGLPLDQQNKFFFYIDSEEPGTDGYSAPGDMYNETDQVQLDAYKSNTSVVEGPYTDSFGSWVSGFAPIDSVDGTTLALLGIDISAVKWRERIFLAELVPIVITLSLTALLLLYAYFRGKTKRYIVRIEKSEQESEEHKNRLRALYEISTKQKVELPEQIRSALLVGNNTLHTKMAMLNRIEGGTFTVLYCVVPPDTLHEGDVFKLAETYCDITVKHDDVVAISAMGASEYAAHVCYTKFNLETYIGVPVKVGGQLFGTLTFLAPDPHRPDFSESDKDFVRLMGAWVASTLERQEIDRMKSEFVSIASHQLRTPLTGIKWFADLLLRGKAGPLVGDQQEFVKNIALSNDRLIALVEELLNVSRIEKGGEKFQITKKPVDLVPFLRQVAKDAEPTATAPRIKLTLPESATISADQEKLRQVFQNLFSNALKYGADKPVEVVLKQAGNTVDITIADHGLGIPAKDQDKIFKRFFRAENVQTVGIEGNGLGLYVVKAIVEAHAGILSFTSEENKGTIFVVKIPLQ